MLPVFRVRFVRTAKRGRKLYGVFLHGVQVPFYCDRDADYLEPFTIADRLCSELNRRAGMYGSRWDFALFSGEESRRTDRYARAYYGRNAKKIVREYREFCREHGIRFDVKVQGMELLHPWEK